MKTILIVTLLTLAFPLFALDYGIDRLEEPEVAALLHGKNLAVLTHAAGRSKDGVHLIDSLHKKFNLKKIFAPEHGLRTLADDWVEDGTDEATGLPVISLYKRGSRAPKPEDLQGIDAIVVDLQDVGVRYYTYFSTIAEVMKALAPLNKELILLDRPNLLGGKQEGKVLDPALAGNFTAYHTVPTRHGMTLGELALMVNKENNVNAKLTVIPAAGWKREALVGARERAWVAPSPALVEIEQVSLYALWGALENFNVAVGRGKTNELAFKVLGAPWMTVEESQKFADKLNLMNFEGLKFVPYSWKVTRALHEGKLANGIMLSGNPDQVRSDEFTYKVASLLIKLFRERLNMDKISPLGYGSQAMVEAMKSGKAWDEYKKIIDAELDTFKVRRVPFLLY